MKRENPTHPLARGGILRRHGALIILLYVFGLSLTLFIYLLVPKYYRAKASLLQPPEAGTQQPSRLSDELPAQIRTNTELFLSILASQRMQDDMITKFDLVGTYNARNMDEAREILTRRTKVALSGNKVIQIEIVDRSPERVAEMANFYAENLDRLTKELTVTAAKQNRIFIEKRLEETSQSIATLETRLQKIQEINKLVADRELGELTKNAGRLMEQLLDKQLELERKKILFQESAPEIVLLKKEIAEIKRSLSKLLESQDELTKILRELRSQETIYSLLTTRLEEAKISEAKDMPIVQILDTAPIPDKIYKPSIKIILSVVSTVLGIVSFLIVFFDILRYLGSI